MQTPWRQLLRQLLVALVLVTWVGGQIAASVHQLQVMHSRCIEHGELIELSAGGDHPHDRVHDVAQSPASDEDHDDDHCTMPGLAPISEPELVAVTPPRAGEPPAARLHWKAAPARGPPLAYAPKTSPPDHPPGAPRIG